MNIKFCGGVSSVTGSCHLITVGDNRILLDCGQFQGGKAEESKNYDPFPFEPSEIDFMILSHGHIDHCGRIPLLVKRGFSGAVYCTDATADLLPIMLKDSAHIQEKEAEWKNRKAERAGTELVEPLYTMADAEESLKYIHPVMYDELMAPLDNVKFVLNDAGHILGSAIVELWTDEDGDVTKTVFSGDLGVPDRPILRNPTIIKKADHVIMETTYGNRLHEKNATSIDHLMKIVVDTVKNKGTVVIPSFAVGRTQELIFEFNSFYEEHEDYKRLLKDVKIYVDSPMAASATEVFRKNAQVFDDEMREFILKGDSPLDFGNLIFTESTQDSIRLNENSEPKIIISASGMCEAGRIRHHLKHHLWRPNSSVVFVGYQAQGTLGRRLVEGAEVVTLFGEDIHVNAAIHNLEGFSGHADRDGLTSWLSGFKEKPANVFLVHGEDESKKDFAKYIKKEIDIDCTVIEGVSEYDLIKGKRTTALEAGSDFAGEEEIDDVRRRISRIHDELETILYNTHLAVDSHMDTDRITDIRNKVLSLEKDTVKLGSSISEKP